jgi:hypothetical protein
MLFEKMLTGLVGGKSAQKIARQNGNVLPKLLVLVAAGTLGVSAGTIVGGSNLLSTADVSQLEMWLGEGPLTLTNVFDKQLGDGQAAVDFHAAANNLGRTFSIVRLRDATLPSTAPWSIVGGYNPSSWHSGGTFTSTIPDSERTAFIFNMSSGLLQRQRLSTDPNATYGHVQTSNDPAAGPMFGLGDLFVRAGFDPTNPATLELADLQQWSYGVCGNVSNCQNLLGQAAWTTARVLDLEVFTIEQSQVPEPGTWALLSAGLTALFTLRKRAQ